MAELLATWLNEEVGLSKKITNFEQDFASGYLFGELLYKFNQQSDFELFSSKDINTHHVRNFEKLEPTLRNLNIKFDSMTVDKIMKEERGQALRLLYQLKMVLEKVYPPTDIVVLSKTGQFGDSQPAQKIAKPREKYDSQQHEFFKHRLAALNKPQKQINMDQHLHKFVVEAERQAKVAADALEAEKQQQNLKKQDLRRIQINKLQRNAGFMEEWQAKGVEDWKKNQKKKKEREMSDLEFDYKQAQKFNAVAVQRLQDAHSEVFDGIAKFENTLKAQSVDAPIQEQEDSDHGITIRQQSLSPSATKMSTLQVLEGGKNMTTINGAFTLASTGLKQRTKKTMTEASRVQRAKRRRRLIGQQEEQLFELDQKQRENMVVDLMKRQSAQEKELEYEVWRTTQCKNVIIENRNLRENQYKKRKEMDIQIAQEKEARILEAEQEQTERLIDEKMDRNIEMNYYGEQAKKKKHTEFCSGLLDRILDIADEAYQHRQKMDSKEIDPRNWHEWLQLFISQQTIAGTHEKLAMLLPEETAGADSTKLETEEDDANAKLDELEMVDYVKNQGQWHKDLVAANKPNLEQILNPPAEPAAAANAKKGAPAKGAQAAAEVQFEADDLEIKDEPDNNFLLGDAIERIIKLNHEDRPKLKHPQTPNWLPLKLALVGYPFSGKKKQAELAKIKHGLDVFVMDELINEAIEFSKKHPNPIEASPIKAQPSISEISAFDIEMVDPNEPMSEDEEGFINSQEDFRQCGLEIEELLLSGAEISDQLYVKLFVSKLRMTYEYKDPQTQRLELKQSAKLQFELRIKLQEIDEELGQEGLNKKRQKTLEAERETVQKRLETSFNLKEQGWILVDFPCTSIQAKLLEQALSGYQSEEELELTERQKQLNDAFLIVQPNPKEQPPKTLIKSGLDAVIWFDMERKDSLRRADGRRIDCEDSSHNIYLVDGLHDPTAPTDQAPLCERLRHIDDDSNSAASLIDRYLSFDQATPRLKAWFAKFGIEQLHRNLLCEIPAGREIPSVQLEVDQIIDELMTIKRTNHNNARDGLVTQMLLAYAEKVAKKDAEEQEVLPERIGTPKSVIADRPVNPDKKPTDPKASVASISKFSEAIPESIVRDRIDNDFKPVVIQLWSSLSRNYKNQMKKIFKHFRLQREQILTRRSDIQHKFLTFLHNADTKQAVLDEFVEKFNSFSDEYVDLREDDQTKEELHQRTDVFSDELWEIVEERKEQSAEFRKQIMESGTCEYAQQFITTVAQQLMQAELDKFKVSVQILQDYYHAIEEKLIPEAAPMTTADLGFDDGDAPAVETLPDGADAMNADVYTYPRLDRLLLLALKQQIVPDVTQQNQAVDPKKGAPAKGKAPPAKGGPTQAEEDKAIEESIYVKELKEAIKVEKGIYRYRLIQIRNWSLKNLRETRKDFIAMYKKMEDWIFVAQRAEMEAIEQMCMLIKDHIESEKKIKSELRMKFMDFTVDKGTLNFITPPPPLLEALEEFCEDRFSIDQLKFLMQEFEQMEAASTTSEQFRDRSVIDMLISKRNASIGFGGYLSALPNCWQHLTQSQIRHMAMNLDPASTGLINWRTMFTYFALLRSPIPSEADIKSLKDSCKAQKVPMSTFMKAKFWFDKTEGTHDKPGYHVFDRLGMLKELLFKTHSHLEGTEHVVDIADLCSILQTPHVQHPKTHFKDYNEFLFAAVRKMNN